MKRETWGTQRRTPCAFTMIELIVVMGIIVLLISFAAPVYTTITRGGGPRAGVNQVADYLTVVRQKAVTSRQRTAVIFALATNVVSWSTTNDYLSHLVSYAPLIETNDTVWVYLDRWQHLPKGAYFSTLPSAPFSSAWAPFPTNSSPTTKQFYAIVFTPAGEAVSAETFKVSEGTVVDGNVVSTNAYNTLSASVYRVTGHVKVHR